MRRLLILLLLAVCLVPEAAPVQAQATADQLNKLSLEALTTPAPGGNPGPTRRSYHGSSYRSLGYRSGGYRAAATRSSGHRRSYRSAAHRSGGYRSFGSRHATRSLRSRGNGGYAVQGGHRARAHQGRRHSARNRGAVYQAGEGYAPASHRLSRGH